MTCGEEKVSRLTDTTIKTNPTSKSFSRGNAVRLGRLFFCQDNERRKEPIRIIFLGRLLSLLLVHLFHGNCYL
jgi:hypothetical protein